MNLRMIEHKRHLKLKKNEVFKKYGEFQHSLSLRMALDLTQSQEEIREVEQRVKSKPQPRTGSAFPTNKKHFATRKYIDTIIANKKPKIIGWPRWVRRPRETRIPEPEIFIGDY